MDLMERIDELQLLVEEAKAVPLSTSAVINREEVLELIAQLKKQVPDYSRQARWMTRDRDQLLGRARKEAERIVAEAQSQRERLLARSEIVLSAQEEGQRIIADAHERAAAISLDADEYIDGRLAAFQEWLDRTSTTVGRGREQLARGRKTEERPEEVQAAPASNGSNGDRPFDAAELGSPLV